VLYFLGFVIPGIVGLILGINGKKRSIASGAPTGMATAGIILSIVAIAMGILFIAFCVATIWGDVSNEIPNFPGFPDFPNYPD